MLSQSSGCFRTRMTTCCCSLPQSAAEDYGIYRCLGVGGLEASSSQLLHLCAEHPDPAGPASSGGAEQQAQAQAQAQEQEQEQGAASSLDGPVGGEATLAQALHPGGLAEHATVASAPAARLPRVGAGAAPHVVSRLVLRRVRWLPDALASALHGDLEQLFAYELQRVQRGEQCYPQNHVGRGWGRRNGAKKRKTGAVLRLPRDPSTNNRLPFVSAQESTR